MKLVKLALLTGAILGLSLAPTFVNAKEVDHDVGSLDTEVGIKIVEPRLWMMEVNNLDFGIKEVGETTAIAKNDLVVKLKDNRFNPESKWRLSLRITPFTSETGQQLGNTTVHFKKAAVLKENKNETNITEYDFDGGPNQIQVIARQMQQTGAGLYEYKVAKENISMTLPVVTQPGKYKASMDWVVTDAP